MIVGGKGPRRTPALAARYATEFNGNFQSRAAIAEQFGRVRKACEEAGRDPDDLVYSVALTLACGRDEAEFARRAAAIGRTPAQLRSEGIAGTPAEVVDSIRALGEIGASRVYLQVLDLSDIEHLELVAAEVAPHVAG